MSFSGKMQILLVYSIIFTIFIKSSVACSLLPQCKDLYHFEICQMNFDPLKNMFVENSIILRCPDGKHCSIGKTATHMVAPLSTNTKENWETFYNTFYDILCANITPPSPPTTTPLPITQPTCTSSAKYPAESCYQYYQCVQVLWWWIPILITCPNGQTFDLSTKNCTDSGIIDCKPTTTTTTTEPTTRPTTTTTTTEPTTRPTTTTTTTEPPVTPPSECTGAKTFPAPKRNQYYECAYVWFKWRLYLKTCPERELYYAEFPFEKCMPDWFVDPNIPMFPKKS